VISRRRLRASVFKKAPAGSSCLAVCSVECCSSYPCSHSVESAERVDRSLHGGLATSSIGVMVSLRYSVSTLIYERRITAGDYTMTEIVTLRVDGETKRKIKRYGIPVSQIARAAILSEIERREREEALQALKRMREILSKVDTKRVIGHIREDRTAR